MAIEGTLDLQGTPCVFFGCGDALSPSTSAYAVFQSQLPEFIGFGGAQEPFGLPTDVEIVQPSGSQP